MEVEWGAESLQECWEITDVGSEWLGKSALSVRAVWGRECLSLCKPQDSTALLRLPSAR